MRYYAARDIAEHYLYAKEVANLAFSKCGVASSSGKPHYRMIKAMLDADTRDKRLEELFYQTRNGLCRVYQTEVVNKVLRWTDWPGYIHKDGIYSICIAGKWWKYRILEDTNV